MRRLAVLACVVSSSAAAQERVQPGDRLLLRRWGEAQPRLDTLFVDLRGDAVFPGFGVLRVTDYRVADIRDSVQFRMKRYFEGPVDLVVLKKVTVVGEVKEPDVFYVDGTSTVSDLIARAGGITEAGHPRKVELVRNGEATPIPDWAGPSGGRLQLMSGDQITVGRRSWLERNGVQLGGLSVAILSLFISLRR
jgi:polysaccharide export outer membrane protein